MTSSQVVLFTVLCIPLVLLFYFLFSLPRVSRRLRMNNGGPFDVYLAVLFFSFYFCAFLLFKKGFLFFENVCLLDSWLQMAEFFLFVTCLVLLALWYATGFLTIKAPSFFVERALLMSTNQTEVMRQIERLVKEQGGEVLLDLPEKNMSIVQVALPEKMVIEFSWQSIFRNTIFVQMVCYPASREASVNKTKLAHTLTLFRME